MEETRDALEGAVAARTAERAAANATLRRSDDARRRFLADVSHELRTPITVIRGEAEVALRAERPGEEYRRALTRVAEEAAMSLSRAGRRIELTGREMALLDLPMTAGGRVVPRARILAAIWGGGEEALTNIVDVHIRRLRRKLEEETGGTPEIITVRGHGYRLDPEASRPAAPAR